MGRKSDSWLRWPILVLSCMAMFGSYYCFDNPSALQKPLKRFFGFESDIKYNMLYSVYSYPNIILPLFGGALLDFLGLNWSLIIFLGLCILGQAVFALAASTKLYWLALVGRTIYGFGGESLCVAETTLLAMWFRGKEMALAMGINLTVSRLGSVANDNLSPLLNSEIGFAETLWFGFGLLIFCMLCVFSMIMLDSYANKKFGNDVESAGGESVKTPFSIQYMLRFSFSYWLLTFSCFVVYATILPFNNIASGFLIEKYGVGEKKAGAIMGVPFLISAIGSPLLGGFVDRVGQRAYLLTLSAGALFVCHFIFAVSDVTPYVSLVIMGCAYAVYSSVLWPSIAMVVPKEKTAFAYGLTTAVQNFGIAVVPSIVGALRNSTGSYKAVSYFFFCLDIVGVALGILIVIADARNGGVLNKTRIGRPVALQEETQPLIVDTQKSPTIVIPQESSVESTATA